MIRVTYKDEISRAFPNHLLEEIGLELAGGGETEKQVIVAMILKDNLINPGYAKLNGGKLHITLTDDGAAQQVIEKAKGEKV